VLLEDFLVDFLLVVAASQDRKVVSKSLWLPEITKIKLQRQSNCKSISYRFRWSQCCRSRERCRYWQSSRWNRNRNC
jgi:hypothetical protein